MYLSNTINGNLPLLDAGVIAVLGYAVVFFGLILLMAVVTALGKAFTVKTNAKTAPAAPVSTPSAPAAQAAPAAQSAAPSQLAPGSAGQIKLHDVPPKTAAMLIAIVAHKLGKPLNELRFTSIKEVK